MNATVPLLEAYRRAGATIGEVYGASAGLALAPAGRGLWLADLSPLPKWLLLGRDAAAALTAAGFAAPSLMEVSAAAAGAFVACAAPRQYLVSAGDAGVPPPALSEARCALRYDCVDLALGGGQGEDGIDDLLAEACTTEFASFLPGAWIPTLCCGVEAALWRLAPQIWRVIAAPADGAFLAASLLDAVHRRHGALAGYRDFLDVILSAGR